MGWDCALCGKRISGEKRAVPTGGLPSQAALQNELGTRAVKPNETHLHQTCSNKIGRVLRLLNAAPSTSTGETPDCGRRVARPHLSEGERLRLGGQFGDAVPGARDPAVVTSDDDVGMEPEGGEEEEVAEEDELVLEDNEEMEENEDEGDGSDVTAEWGHSAKRARSTRPLASLPNARLPGNAELLQAAQRGAARARELGKQLKRQ